jgi:predicted NAD/FAD-binding protein
LEKLKVPWRWSNMSFGFYDCNSNLQYAGVNLNALFAQRSNVFSVAFLKMLLEIKRFAQTATREIPKLNLETSLGAFLSQHNFSKELVHYYILPIGAAIWSAPDSKILDFPALTFLHFFSNHGLLSLQNRPQWQTVVGGSKSYVEKFLQVFSGSVRTNSAVARIERNADSVSLTLNSGDVLHFDALVLATHADVALKLLADVSPQEQQALGAWDYQDNLTILHTDESFLPPCKRAWASWNYRRERGEQGAQPVSVTYHMNRLQGFHSTQQYCVTLNPRQRPHPDKIIYEVLYRHPVYSKEAVQSQALLQNIQGQKRTWFCGSYHGFGFHEDAAKSAATVGAMFNTAL